MLIFGSCLQKSIPASSDQATQATIQAVQTINPNVVNDVPPHNWQLSNAYNAGWAQLPVDQKLAVLELLYYANEIPYKGQALAALVGAIYALCKSSNVSDGWLTNQLNRIRENYPDLDVTAKVTIDSITTFKQLFIPDNIDPNILSNFLQAVYPCLEGTQANCLTWVIEQTRGHSCAHATAFADTISEFNGSPLIYLTRLPDNSVVNFLRLATIVIVDPWSTLHRPSVPAREYVELANFGLIAKKAMNKDFHRYQGTFISGGVYSEPELRAIYEMCQLSQEALLEESLDPSVLISGIIPGISATAIGGDVYVSDLTNRQLNLDERSLTAIHGPSCNPCRWTTS